MQLALLGNASDGDVTGMQLAAVVNVASRVRGVQFGLINWCDNLSGFQIGLLNFSTKHRFPLVPFINIRSAKWEDLHDTPAEGDEKESEQ